MSKSIIKWESKKSIESPYGKLELSRRVFQSSKGGKQYAQLDESVGLVGQSTPRFAKMLSWKYAQMPSERVAEDL
jgi:hypothetical protein